MEEDNKSTFIKMDDNRAINLTHIRWIRKYDACLEICIKSDGCSFTQTHRLCKINNPASFEKLNKVFDVDSY